MNGSAHQLRSALGETNITISLLQRLTPCSLTGQPITTLGGKNQFEEAIARLQKIQSILESEIKLVENGQTPTLRIGSDLNDLSSEFGLMAEYLKQRDA